MPWTTTKSCGTQSCSNEKVATRGDGGEQVFFELACRHCERACLAWMCFFCIPPSMTYNVRKNDFESIVSPAFGVFRLPPDTGAPLYDGRVFVVFVFSFLLPSHASLLAWEVPHWPPESMCDCYLCLILLTCCFVPCRRQCQRAKQHERPWAPLC